MDININEISNSKGTNDSKIFKNSIKVMIVDDQAIIREGLSYLLSGFEEIDILCEASNGTSAIKLLESNSPDVILMDIRMPEMNGVEATKIIKNKYNDIKIIMFTTFDDDEYIIEAMAGGASGYLLKDTDSRNLVQAIKNVYAGNIIMPGAVFQKFAGSFSQNVGNDLNKTEISHNLNNSKSIQSFSVTEEFTQRESDIVKLLLEGKSNREISEQLFLTIGTTKNYLSQIYMKLQVSDRANAILALKGKLGKQGDGSSA